MDEKAKIIKDLQVKNKELEETLGMGVNKLAEHIANTALQLAVDELKTKVHDYLNEYLDRHDKKLKKLFNAEGERMAKALHEEFKKIVKSLL